MEGGIAAAGDGAGSHYGGDVDRGSGSGLAQGGSLFSTPPSSPPPPLAQKKSTIGGGTGAAGAKAGSTAGASTGTAGAGKATGVIPSMTEGASKARKLSRELAAIAEEDFKKLDKVIQSKH